MNRAVAGLASLAATLGFAGCSLGDSPRDGLLTRTDEPSAEMAAVVGGRLSIDDSCVLLSGSPVVWPAGTTLSDDGSSIELPNGMDASDGDAVHGAGGEIPAAGIRRTALRFDGDLDAALECAPSATDVVVFWVDGDGMTVS